MTEQALRGFRDAQRHVPLSDLTPKNPPDGSPKAKELTIREISATTFKMKDNQQQVEATWTRVKE